ncbi:MAG: NADH-quinone oxidoreductase subunit C [Candidatus Thermoplasmatota archaeon]|nr:NADH-quinone oxidoreductase subunit C [Candidatus Thermoplasmatota archaeon]
MREGGRSNQDPTGNIERAPLTIGEDPEEHVLRTINDEFGKSVEGSERVRAGLIRARLARDSLYDACKLLRDDLGFEHLSMISAVDYPDRFEIVYHINSYQSNIMLELIVKLPKDDPTVDSISSIWGGANWNERESYDLMGIVFNDHPKLERILLPKDTMYHPLRKDFRM